MSIIFAIICGIIQGAAEFLPISSSGHLAIFQNIFGAKNIETDYMAFSVLLHLGTLAAVFVIFRKDIVKLIKAFFTMLKKVFTGKFKLEYYTVEERTVIMLLIATLPLVIAALVSDYVEIISSYTWAVGLILIINGLILFVSDKMETGKTKPGSVTPKNALIIGICQMCAVLPGLSRSGSTITGGLTQGFDRRFAVKFSFLLSIPAILGANIKELPTLAHIPSGDVAAYIIGTVVAFIAGIAAMKLLLYISKHSNFRIFSYYCFAVGAITFILGIAGVHFNIFG